MDLPVNPVSHLMASLRKDSEFLEVELQDLSVSFLARAFCLPDAG